VIKLRTISLGAGVQSTTMALMAARGEAGPMPDCAIFADTGWEPKATYEHLDRLEKLLPFPVHRVSAGNIRDDLLRRSSARSGRFITVPFFLKHANGEQGIGRRQCTTHYKIEPITRKIRELLGVGPRGHMGRGAVEVWIGISVDEVVRATPSKRKFEVKRFPLIEAGMNRRECIKWLQERQYPVPQKSACVGCPFHGDATWRDMRDNRPDEFAQAVAADRAIRESDLREGVAKVRAEQFMHRSMVPLDEVDLRTDAEAGQPDLFDHECEGYCGV
jgi:hypothetical protein